MIGTDLRYRLTFDVFNNTLTFLDLLSANYTGTIKGIISFLDPDGIIFYQNPGWATNDFSSPDISTGTWSKAIPNFPLEASTNFAKLGNYTVSYKVSIGSAVIESIKSFNLDYARPTPVIRMVANTNESTLNISDNSNYIVTHGGDNVIPAITYGQTLVAPVNPETGLPVVANVTSSQKTFSVGPNIYSRVYTDTLNNSLSYDFEKWDLLTWIVIQDTILGSKIEDVKDDTCMCAYYNCIASLQLQMDAVRGENVLQYNKLRKAKDSLNDYMGMYLWAVKCGQDSAYWCKKIKEILVVNTPCDCAQDDDAPHEIIPIFGSGGGTVITPSLFQYTFGTGDAGFPSTPHAGDIHQFTATDTASPNVYFKGDIYSYSGSAWTFRLNVMGAKGDPGASASGVSAITLYSDLTLSGTPAGTANTTLKTYTLPALTMVNNGDQLKILASYILTKNDNGKAAGITFNGDLVASFYSDALITDITKYLRLEAEVNRINLISQMTVGAAKRLGGFTNEPMQTLNSANLSNAVVINAMGQNDVAESNDLICNQLTVSLFSMVNGAILGNSNFAQGIVSTVGGTPLDIVFASTFASANYTLSINCYDSEGNPQTFTIDKNYKTTSGFRIETLVTGTSRRPAAESRASVRMEVPVEPGTWKAAVAKFST